MTAAPVPPILRPYASTSAWTEMEAAHLFRRAGWNADVASIRRAAADGLNSTLTRILEVQDETDEFRETSELLYGVARETGNIDDLKAWWLYRMTYSANGLAEKMTVFWHNRFATSYAKVRSVEHMANQHSLIRQHALGSFRELLHGMTRDVAMLIWLDGNANRKRHPNENFARELMELFSLDVGNYSERDIQEAARAFSGWHVRNDRFWFNRLQHDNGPKTVLGKTGNWDGQDVVELCLAQPACPRFLARRLYQTFVAQEVPEAVLVALAQRIREHDYQLRPVLRELLGSELFFAPAARHALIKSPLDLVVGSLRGLEVRPNLNNAVRVLRDMGQDVFEPPTVKGWEGGRLWISSATMLQRANLAADLAYRERYGKLDGFLRMPDGQKDLGDESVCDFYARILLGRDPEPSLQQRLVDYFQKLQGQRETKVRHLIHLVMTLPEYQLM